MTITKYIKPEPLLIYVLLQDLSLSWLLHSAQWYITKLVFKKNHLTGFVINKIPLSPQLAELWTSLPPDLAFPPRYTHPGSSQTGQSPAGTWIQRKMKMSLNVVVAGRIFGCEFTYCGPCEWPPSPHGWSIPERRPCRWMTARAPISCIKITIIKKKNLSTLFGRRVLLRAEVWLG